MSDEIKQVQDRLRKIEDDLVAERATRTANRRWAAAAGLVLISWLGYTSFYQIPKAVDQSSTGQVAREAEQARDRATTAATRISALADGPDSFSARLDSLRTALRTAPHSQLPASGGNGQTSLCPPGSYMIGARFQIDPGGDHGQISNIIPICKPVLPPEPVRQP
jgi:hypothetical protein